MVLLRILFPFVFLGPVPFRSRHWFVRALLTSIRHAILLSLSTLMVWAAFYLKGPDIQSRKELTEKADAANASLDALKNEVKNDNVYPDKLRLEVKGLSDTLPDDKFFLLKLKYGIPEERDARSVEVNRPDGTVGTIRMVKSSDYREFSLLEVKPALGDWKWVRSMAKEGLWPIREVSFPVGAYVGSALVVGVNKELTPSDVEKIRRLLDPILESLPSAKDKQLVWARRLVGEIQLGCYLMACYGFLLMAVSWFSRVLPNTILREERWHQLDGVVADRIEVDKDSYMWRLRRRAEDAHPSASPAGDLIPSPWLGKHVVSGTAEAFERFYAELGEQTRKRMALGILDPMIPLTDMRRLGYMALRSSPGGETVPNFMSVEADGVYEGLLADNRSVEYLIWAIPTLGFVGTVLGIGEALSATVDLESAVLATKISAGAVVGSQIGLAFDTTFVALLLSFVLMLAYTGLQKAQELMLSREKQLALKEIFQPQNIQSFRSTDGLQTMLSEINEQLKLLTKAPSKSTYVDSRVVRAEPSEPIRIRKPFSPLSWFVLAVVLATGAISLMGGFDSGPLSAWQGQLQRLFNR